MLFPSLRDVDRFPDAQAASPSDAPVAADVTADRGREAEPSCGRGLVGTPGPIETQPAEAGRARLTRCPRPGEIRVRVSVCGVCRTDLHLAEGDLAPRRRRCRARVTRSSDGSTRSARARRASRSAIASASRGCAARVASAGSVSGATRTCASRRASRDGTTTAATRRWRSSTSATRTRCPTSSTTRPPRRCCARDHRVPRAASSAVLPEGGRLGVYGFGASAHLAAQVAMCEGATVHVLTRSPEARRLALDLGAASAGDAYDLPPEPLDAAILFAPVGDLVPVALARARSRRHARDRGHPPHRHARRSRYERAPLPGAHADVGHREHAARRRRAARHRRREPACAS